MHGQRIEAPDAVYGTTANFGKIEKKLEFRVEKAKEFESFRQIPKYKHASLAVIHPSPTREKRKIWRPASSLGFDGLKNQPQMRRKEPKNIAEHLTKPPIDDALIIKLKGAKDPTCRQRSTKWGRCGDCRVQSNAAEAKKGSRGAKLEKEE